MSSPEENNEGFPTPMDENFVPDFQDNEPSNTSELKKLLETKMGFPMYFGADTNPGDVYSLSEDMTYSLIGNSSKDSDISVLQQPMDTESYASDYAGSTPGYAVSGTSSTSFKTDSPRSGTSATGPASSLSDNAVYIQEGLMSTSEEASSTPGDVSFRADSILLTLGDSSSSLRRACTKPEAPSFSENQTSIPVDLNSATGETWQISVDDTSRTAYTHIAEDAIRGSLQVTGYASSSPGEAHSAETANSSAVGSTGSASDGFRLPLTSSCSTPVVIKLAKAIKRSRHSNAGSELGHAWLATGFNHSAPGGTIRMPICSSSKSKLLLLSDTSPILSSTIFSLSEISLPIEDAGSLSRKDYTTRGTILEPGEARSESGEVSADPREVSSDTGEISSDTGEVRSEPGKFTSDPGEVTSESREASLETGGTDQESGVANPYSVVSPESGVMSLESAEICSKSAGTYPESAGTEPESGVMSLAPAKISSKSAGTYPESAETHPESGVISLESAELCSKLAGTYPESAGTHPESGETCPESGVTTQALEASSDSGETGLESGETSSEPGPTSLESGVTCLAYGGTSPESGETSSESGKTGPESGESSPKSLESSSIYGDTSPDIGEIDPECRESSSSYEETSLDSREAGLESGEPDASSGVVSPVLRGISSVKADEIAGDDSSSDGLVVGEDAWFAKKLRSGKPVDFFDYCYGDESKSQRS